MTSGNNILEESDGKEPASDAQFEILFLQPVDEAAFLVEDGDDRLNEFGVDSDDVVLRLLLAENC